MAGKHGKRGKEVEALLSRQKSHGAMALFSVVAHLVVLQTSMHNWHCDKERPPDPVRGQVEGLG